ncbi:hypothetical protein [Amphibiibacter pelophylacis]|uniref:Uncharacterized protein n=1 Tax=Amphibiibacter pelophylacis TaxID=1799477 RepID=A0ACC6P096_9BURK
MNILSKTLVAGLGCVLCGLVMAQPSGGFSLLRNKNTGHEACGQVPFSPDWLIKAGPFKDQDCKIPEEPQVKQSNLPASPLDLPGAAGPATPAAQVKR